MDDKNVIATALSDCELAKAFSELVAERWDNWDLSVYLPYLVDTCAVTVLPYLADQFDVEGLQGFSMAVSEEQRRDIIKKSIALHKFLGTPWAIREACRTVGFPVILLEENVTAIPGGPESPEDWARFRILIEADTTRHVTEDEARKLRQFVEYYKNERSHLVELGFSQIIADPLVFHSNPSNRDSLEISTLEVKPNPVIIDPSGNLKNVYVESSIPWTISGHVFMWEDGSGDQVTIKFTGSAGSSVIMVDSDPNETGNREIIIPIVSEDNRMLGSLTLRQLLTYSNAYSNDYNRAYNNYPMKSVNAYSPSYNKSYFMAYMRATPTDLTLSGTAESPQQFDVTTNVKWRIE